MAEFNGKTGVWRTVGGRRIFIVDGEDLASAMKRSGKFTSKKDIEHQKRKLASQVENNEFTTEEERKDIWNKYDAFDKLSKDDNNKSYYNKETKETITEKDIDKNYNKYGKDMQRNEYEKKVTDSLKNSGWEEKMSPIERDIIQEKERLLQKNPHMSVQDLNDKLNDYAYDNLGSYNKDIERIIDKASGWDVEKDNNYTKDKNDYELYKKAKLAPDSIDPMTENSTDWEALDKKYSERFDNDPNNSFSNTRDYALVDLDYNAYRRRLEQVEYKINDDRLDSMQRADYRKERNDIKLKMQNLDYERNRAIKNEYNQYKKEHPNTDLTYEDYKKIKRGY